MEMLCKGHSFQKKYSLLLVVLEQPSESVMPSTITSPSTSDGLVNLIHSPTSNSAKSFAKISKSKNNKILIVHKKTSPCHCPRYRNASCLLSQPHQQSCVREVFQLQGSSLSPLRDSKSDNNRQGEHLDLLGRFEMRHT